jgi:hypothetical protein
MAGTSLPQGDEAPEAPGIVQELGFSAEFVAGWEQRLQRLFLKGGG